ncbi:hypothetical protein GF343_02610 [Candidatus Woesearchaeota archaeon]|nr:hypothetical protein [Candidatus Woesearchaeota archaeon]
MEYEKLDDNSRELVCKILDAAEEERDIVQQIRRISGGSDISGVKNMTLSADKTAIPEELQTELGEKRAELARYMKEAVGRGLGSLPMVKKNYEKYAGEPIPD